MSEFQLALMSLKAAIAAANAAVAAKEVYAKFKEQAQRTNALTPEESEALDRKEAEIAASPAQEQSGR